MELLNLIQGLKAKKDQNYKTALDELARLEAEKIEKEDSIKASKESLKSKFDVIEKGKLILLESELKQIQSEIKSMKAIIEDIDVEKISTNIDNARSQFKAHINNTYKVDEAFNDVLAAKIKYIEAVENACNLVEQINADVHSIKRDIFSNCIFEEKVTNNRLYLSDNVSTITTGAKRDLDDTLRKLERARFLQYHW